MSSIQNGHLMTQEQQAAWKQESAGKSITPEYDSTAHVIGEAALMCIPLIGNLAVAYYAHKKEKAIAEQLPGPDVESDKLLRKIQTERKFTKQVQIGAFIGMALIILSALGATYFHFGAAIDAAGGTAGGLILAGSVGAYAWGRHIVSKQDQDYQRALLERVKTVTYLNAMMNLGNKKQIIKLIGKLRADEALKLVNFLIEIANVAPAQRSCHQSQTMQFFLVRKNVDILKKIIVQAGHRGERAEELLAVTDPEVERAVTALKVEEFKDYDSFLIATFEGRDPEADETLLRLQLPAL
jgi:hypothetical protein